MRVGTPSCYLCACVYKEIVRRQAVVNGVRWCETEGRADVKEAKYGADMLLLPKNVWNDSLRAP